MTSITSTQYRSRKAPPYLFAPPVWMSPDEGFICSVCDQSDCDELVKENAKRQYREKNAAATIAQAIAVSKEEQLARLRVKAARIGADLESTKLLGVPFKGRRPQRLAGHDYFQYAVGHAVSYAGCGVATYTLACYIVDAQLVDSLSHLEAAFCTAFPVIGGSLFLKARAAAKPDDAAKARFYDKVARGALAALAAFVVSAAVSFAPHHVDPAAFQSALLNGVSLSDQIGSWIKGISPYVTVASGLATEVFVSPILSEWVDTLHSAGREIRHETSQTWRTLEAELNKVEAEIVEVAKVSAEAQACANDHAIAMAALVTRSQRMAKEMAAEIAAHQARSRAAFKPNSQLQ